MLPETGWKAFCMWAKKVIQLHTSLVAASYLNLTLRYLQHFVVNGY